MVISDSSSPLSGRSASIALNRSLASRTVLPLPTQRTAAYGGAAGRLEDDPVYRRNRQDFERYHTRYVVGQDVRDALRTDKIETNQP